jgi:DNA repair exonuclease SbcCD nuclease subunit
MGQLFKKAAVFCDLHIGLKSNSDIHNQDCLNYIYWFVEEAQKNNCDICLFLGDYFHNRNNTNLKTMNYGIRGLRILSDAFDKTIMIPGNHDLFYRDQRTISSIAWAEHIPNIEIINDITAKDDVVFVPWLLQGENKQLFKNKGEYVFAHLELPKFLMNSFVEMPEVGELRAEQFEDYYKVFTGHFHKRQTRGNITYIGNAFPHNFGDADDDDRGMMILPWGEEPTFITWPNAPKYRNLKISDLVVDPSKYLPQHGYIKLFLDSKVTYEEATYLKENLIEEYELRELSLVTMKKDLHGEDSTPGGNVQFQSVDNIVQSQIVNNIASEYYDTNLLLEIYKNL